MEEIVDSPFGLDISCTGRLQIHGEVVDPFLKFSKLRFCKIKFKILFDIPVLLLLVDPLSVIVSFKSI